MVKTSDSLNGFVDSGCTIRGELEFSSSFRIDGRIEGKVRSNSELIIGEGGVVEGEIEVARCAIGGEVHGTIVATESVVLHNTARVFAEIRTKSLVMEDGAFLEGKVSMENMKSATTSAKKIGK